MILNKLKIHKLNSILNIKILYIELNSKLKAYLKGIREISLKKNIHIIFVIKN